jgi:hypothetical protein
VELVSAAPVSLGAGQGANGRYGPGDCSMLIDQVSQVEPVQNNLRKTDRTSLNWLLLLLFEI